MTTGNYRIVICAIVLAVSGSFVMATDESTDGDGKDEMTSLTQDRGDVLKYGIEEEVSGLLNTLKDEKDETSLDDAFEAFSYGVSPKLKTVFLEYFQEVEFRGAEDIVIDDLLEAEDLDASYRLGAINYLSSGKNPKAVEVYRMLLESDETGVIRAAVKALGGSGTSEDAQRFLEYLDDSDFPNEVKPELILSLGELEDPIARARLIEIIEDEFEEKSWRMYACVSLARINNPEDVGILYDVFQSTSDPLVRSYAVASLGYYDTEQAETALIQSLRDSFWRVRVNGAKALGERKSLEAVEILKYKALKDPEVRVRVEAIQALGQIGTRESYNTLQEIFKKEGSDIKLRSAALEALAAGDIDASMPVFEEVIASQWDKSRSAVLEITAKRLSRSESSKLEPVFERFLSHPEITVKIHGIRGIRYNRFSGLKERIEELAAEGNHRSIRKEALAALEAL